EVDSVPADRVAVGQRTAGRAVAAADVVQAPGDLGGRVGPPVRADRGHLRAGQRLRDAVGARARVLRGGVPVRLALPQGVEAAELVAAPATCGNHLGGDGLGVTAGDGRCGAAAVGATGAARAGRAGGRRGGAARCDRLGGADAHHLVHPLGDDRAGDELAGGLLAAGGGDAEGRGRDAVDALGDDAPLAPWQAVVLLLDGPVLVGLGDVLVDRLDGGHLHRHAGEDRTGEREGDDVVVVDDHAHLVEQLGDRDGRRRHLPALAVDDELDRGTRRGPRLESRGDECRAVDRGRAGGVLGGVRAERRRGGVVRRGGADEGDGPARDDGKNEGVQAALGDGADVVLRRLHVAVTRTPGGFGHYRVLSGWRAVRSGVRRTGR